MEAITSAVGWLNGIVWGVPMLVLILGVGLFLTLGLKLRTILRIPFGFKLLWQGRIPGGEGEIPEQRVLQRIDMKVDDVELVHAAVETTEHHHVVRNRVGDPRIEPKRAFATRYQLGRRRRISAREQCHVVAHPDELFGQVRDDALGSAI